MLLKALANAPNIIGQQHPTLLGAVALLCSVRLNTVVLLAVETAYIQLLITPNAVFNHTQHIGPTMLDVVGPTMLDDVDPTMLDVVSPTMLDAFFQQCW